MKALDIMGAPLSPNVEAPTVPTYSQWWFYRLLLQKNRDFLVWSRDVSNLTCMSISNPKTSKYLTAIPFRLKIFRESFLLAACVKPDGYSKTTPYETSFYFNANFFSTGTWANYSTVLSPTSNQWAWPRSKVTEATWFCQVPESCLCFTRSAWFSVLNWAQDRRFFRLHQRFRSTLKNTQRKYCLPICPSKVTTITKYAYSVLHLCYGKSQTRRPQFLQMSLREVSRPIFD